MARRTRLIIADDHVMVREGLVALLEEQPDIEVVGQATTGTEAVALVRTKGPELALVDITMPDMNGLMATRAIKAESPATEVLILTMHEEESMFFEALRSGAGGYVLKGSGSDELLVAIRTVADGGTHLPAALTGSLIDDYVAQHPRSRLEDVAPPGIIATAMHPVLEVLTVPPFGENTYLLGDADAGEGLVIDPGGRVADLLRVADRRGLSIVAIAATHAHVDHVMGAAELRAVTGAPFLVHPEAAAALGDVASQASAFGLPPVEVPDPDGDLVPGKAVIVGGLALDVLFTPGHAPGHVTLVTPELALAEPPARVAFCGDAVFLGSIGRTD
ncbi:MAG: response regulator, partial [Anaerolineae bacterium]